MTKDADIRNKKGRISIKKKKKLQNTQSAFVALARKI